MGENEKTYTLDELLETKDGRGFTWGLNPWEMDAVEAVLELRYWHRDKEKEVDIYTLEDLENAVYDIEHHKIEWYPDLDTYHDAMDDLVDLPANSTLSNYFDWDSYHDDLDNDVEEASNGVVLCNR